MSLVIDIAKVLAAMALLFVIGCEERPCVEWGTEIRREVKDFYIAPRIGMIPTAYREVLVDVCVHYGRAE